MRQRAARQSGARAAGDDRHADGRREVHRARVALEERGARRVDEVVLKALAREPEVLEAFLAELATGAACDRRLAAHDDQQVLWQTSVGDGSVSTGWGGRVADLLNAVANPAGNISMSVSLNGANTFEVGNLVNVRAQGFLHTREIFPQQLHLRVHLAVG